ncbi:MAG: RidA family protein [Pseudomonadota bacterium]|uniref:RidA family protein n=1 Tax=Candidatus Desulfatibia profunda TaxID=2841695 RepID=A0A8J6TK71_9BACT|nr:RidA family protein [Candidatus Desulfatibia profunda]MBL7181381.1 RidA family protein [Desulfobacterales bacterium]MBU0697962.1 RidA family protein [Pseudomonadota bacterium]
MLLKVVQTDRAPAAIGPYSQGIAAASWLFVSGQLGLQPETGELAGPDFGSQARRALENLRQIVQAGGGSLKDVAAVDVFLTDMGKFAEFNQIYAEYFSDHRPARAVVEVRALPKGARVEIKCIACLRANSQ